MSDRERIAWSCFIGGVCFGVMAWWLLPNMIYLAIPAGLAGGYVSYKFRETLRAIPKAISFAWHHMGVGFQATVSFIGKQLRQPHHFFYPALILNIPFSIWLGRAMEGGQGDYYDSVWHFLVETVDIFPLFFVMFLLVVMSALIGLAMLGSRYGLKTYYTTDFIGSPNNREIGEFAARGWQEKPLTYGNAFKWILMGLWMCTGKFFLWTFWKHFFVAAVAIIKFVCLTVWFFFKLVHCWQKLLCAIDGTLGGLLVWLCFNDPSMVWYQQALAVLCGGLLGAAFGVLNWELVSVRFLARRGIIVLKGT